MVKLIQWPKKVAVDEYICVRSIRRSRGGSLGKLVFNLELFSRDFEVNYEVDIKLNVRVVDSQSQSCACNTSSREQQQQPHQHQEQPHQLVRRYSDPGAYDKIASL